MPNTSDGLTSENVLPENKFKADSERIVTGNDNHQQKDDRQKDAHFKHKSTANRNDDGKINSYPTDNQKHRNH